MIEIANADDYIGVTYFAIITSIGLFDLIQIAIEKRYKKDGPKESDRKPLVSIGFYKPRNPTLSKIFYGTVFIGMPAWFLLRSTGIIIDGS